VSPAWASAAGSHVGPAQLRAASHNLFEGGTIGRSSCRASCRVTNEQRCTRPLQQWCCRSPTSSAAAARLRRCRLYGRGADRPLRHLNPVHRDPHNPIRLPAGRGTTSPRSRHDRRQKHEKRRFVAKVDSSPRPAARGRRTRAQAGLPQAACGVVVTDLAIMGFDEETCEMQVLALHPGVTARAGPGQHRLRAAVRQGRGDRRAAAPRRARRAPPPRPRAPVHSVSIDESMNENSTRHPGSEASGRGYPTCRKGTPSGQVPALHDRACARSLRPG